MMDLTSKYIWGMTINQYRRVSRAMNIGLGNIMRHSTLIDNHDSRIV